MTFLLDHTKDLILGVNPAIIANPNYDKLPEWWANNSEACNTIRGSLCSAHALLVGGCRQVAFARGAASDADAGYADSSAKTSKYTTSNFVSKT